MSLGGGGSSGGSQQSSVSGFQALSPQIQGVFNTLAQQAGNYLQGGSSSSELVPAYTPAPLTSGENQAINTVNQGFNPTTSQFNSSVNEQMNPYNQDVINLINKNAYGQNSALQSSLQGAGQFASNRATLGANDIANNQAATIGSLLNPEYNTAVNNALTTIPQLNAQSAQSQLQAGQFLQGQQQAANQAPFTGLSALSQILGVLPTNSGSSSGSSSQSGFNFSGSLGFSDERLKNNIRLVGEENGYPLYEFSYNGDHRRFVGVMASDVEKQHPDAIHVIKGYKAVDYKAIGVELRIST